MEYMDAATREYIGVPGSLPNGAGAIPVVFPPPYRRPGGDDLRPDSANSAPIATRAEDVAAELFERRGFASAVLSYGDPMMLPARGASNPMMQRISVLLPLPLVPSSATVSPSRTSSDSPCSTCTWP